MVLRVIQIFLGNAGDAVAVTVIYLAKIARSKLHVNRRNETKQQRNVI